MPCSWATAPIRCVARLMKSTQSSGVWCSLRLCMRSTYHSIFRHTVRSCASMTCVKAQTDDPYSTTGVMTALNIRRRSFSLYDWLHSSALLRWNAAQPAAILFWSSTACMFENDTFLPRYFSASLSSRIATDWPRSCTDVFPLAQSFRVKTFVFSKLISRPYVRAICDKWSSILMMSLRDWANKTTSSANLSSIRFRPSSNSIPNFTPTRLLFATSYFRRRVSKHDCMTATNNKDEIGSPCLTPLVRENVFDLCPAWTQATCSA